MKDMNEIGGITVRLVDEFKRVLPRQRKTQRENLALLVATMLLPQQVYGIAPKTHHLPKKNKKNSLTPKPPHIL